MTAEATIPAVIDDLCVSGLILLWLLLSCVLFESTA
ncbi:hypothetical protein sync_1647 [Synechococcus sp. CC9311]|nr:hypothetical protein sync_1647 [Synechococcus sp. CC9311]